MLEITSPALEKIKEVLGEQGDRDSALRVIAVPAEHGGIQYMMTMEKEVQKEDTIMDMDGVRFVMDSDSEPFLEEATIDYVDELTRVGFVINNPNFSSGGCGAGCGCGNGGGGGCGNGGCGCGSGH